MRKEEEGERKKESKKDRKITGWLGKRKKTQKDQNFRLLLSVNYELVPAHFQSPETFEQD